MAKKDKSDDGECDGKGRWEEVVEVSTLDLGAKPRLVAAYVRVDPVLLFRHYDKQPRSVITACITIARLVLQFFTDILFVCLFERKLIVEAIK